MTLENYPRPIIQHDIARQRTLNRHSVVKKVTFGEFQPSFLNWAFRFEHSVPVARLFNTCLVCYRCFFVDETTNRSQQSHLRGRDQVFVDTQFHQRGCGVCIREH